MTRKRSKSKGDALAGLPGITRGDAVAEDVGMSPVDALPNETLQLIFTKVPFPSRQLSSVVCRRWRDLLTEAPFCRHVAPGQSLSEALQACSPGDTIICPPGMYQETLLVDKPVRLVAEDHWRLDQRQRRRRSRGGPATEPQQQQHGGQGAASPQPLQAAAAAEAGSGAGPSAPPRHGREQHEQLPPSQPLQRQGSAAVTGRPQRGVVGSGAGGGGARPLAPSVSVMSLRPPVVVMDSRCCFVGFEFHTSVAHNEVSICCFGPNSPLARFERCTFSGLTGLRVPYSKGSHTRLELYDCTLIGTTQSLAAVQMDAGRLLLVRCAVQNNSVGVEVGPEALARLTECEVRWCGTAMVVDGCLAMANCRLWGNGKVGNLSTDARLRAAQSLSEACLAAGAPGVLPDAAPADQSQSQPRPARPLTGAGYPPRGARGAAAAAAAAAVAVADVDTAAAMVATATAPNRPRARRRRGSAAGAAPAAAGPADGAHAGGSAAIPNPGGEAAAAATSEGPSGAATSELGPQQQAQQQAAPSSGAAAAALAAVGGVGSGPARVAALAAAQWVEVEAAFGARQQLVRVVGCEVAAPQLIMRTGLHKDVRKKARELVRQVYGAPDDDLFPEWEVLVQSDLDSDLDDEDSSVTSGSVMGDEEELDDEDLDPLDVADDPDLDESGESMSGSDSDSDSGSDSGSGSSGSGGAGAADMDDGEGGAGGEMEGGGGEMEGEDEEYQADDPMSSGGSSSSSGSSSDSDSSGGSDGDSSAGDSGGSGGESGSGGGGSSSSSSEEGSSGPVDTDDDEDAE